MIRKANKYYQVTDECPSNDKGFKKNFQTTSEALEFALKKSKKDVR